MMMASMSLSSREIGRSAEVLAVDVLLNLGLLDVLDVGFARIEHRNFLGIGVESGDFVAGFGKAKAQGKADISAANDADFQLSAFEKFGFAVDCHLSLRRAPDYFGGATTGRQGRKSRDT